MLDAPRREQMGLAGRARMECTFTVEQHVAGCWTSTDGPSRPGSALPDSLRGLASWHRRVGMGSAFQGGQRRRHRLLAGVEIQRDASGRDRQVDFAARFLQ